MLTFTLASFSVAFFAAAGAIPLCRNFYQWVGSTGLLKAATHSDAPPFIAGAGMLLGGAASVYYVEPRPAEVTSLLVAGAMLVLMGAWVDQRRRHASQTTIAARPMLPIELWASVLAVLFLLWPLSVIQGSPIEAMAVVMLVLTPAAIAFLGNSAASVPALPAGVVMTQILLLLLLGLLGAEDGLATYGAFSLVAVPALGALAGAMLYLCRTPWRAKAEVSLGTGACLSLGSLVAWGASRTGLDGAGDGSLLAVMWILSLPVFAWVRQNIETLLTGGTHPAESASFARLLRTQQPPTFAMILVLLSGTIGISLERLQVPTIWSLIALLCSFALFLIVPSLLSLRRGAHATLVAHARRPG
jgi:hypothetical protein